MARQRDYAAEYQRRQAKARQLGYSSYHHRRRTMEEAKRYDGPSRDTFIRLARQPHKGQTPAQVRRLWRQGDLAMRKGDHDQAQAIARQLGYRDTPKGPPQRVFWYH